MKKDKQAIIEFLENFDNDTLMLIHNEFCEKNNDYDNAIFLNDEDFFNNYFNDDKWNLICRIFYGTYKPCEVYVKFNGYGNLESFDCINDFIDFDYIAQQILADEFITDYINFDDNEENNPFL